MQGNSREKKNRSTAHGRKNQAPLMPICDFDSFFVSFPVVDSERPVPRRMPTPSTSSLARKVLAPALLTPALSRSTTRDRVAASEPRRPTLLRRDSRLGRVDSR